MKNNTKITLIAILASMLSGCMNMPTPPAQITGAYTSAIPYKNYSCDDLGVEMNDLARRENQLVSAQDQRIKTSKVQAFWWGYGQGDGIAASQLATVRGEENAVRQVMDQKHCVTGQTRTSSSQILAGPQLNLDTKGVR